MMRTSRFLALVSLWSTPLACYEGMHATTAGLDADDAVDADDGQDTIDGLCSELGQVFLRRLTNAEYRNSVRDLLGHGLDGLTAKLPPDPVAEGFDNNAEAVTISELHVEQYRGAAEAIAAAVITDENRRDEVVGCDPGVAECLEQFVRSFGRRAFRRTLGEDEVADLLALASVAQNDSESAARLVIEGVLQSTSFLYRIEVGEPDASDPSRLRLAGPAVATRLSYLLLASTPPEWLIDRAEAGELNEADGVEAAARELLNDPSARSGLRNFYSQWLQIPLLLRANRDADEQPLWSEELRDSMVEQAYRLVDDFIWGEDASFLDLLVADYAWVDARLAAVYEIPPPREDWERLPIEEDPFRGGLLTLPAIATLTGGHESGMAIYRGKFIREALMCEKMPPPPPDIPTAPDPVEGESDRERLERHRSDPSCAGCHSLLEPLGFGLAHYDSLGAVRLVDAQGETISAKGSFGGFDEVDFDGAIELQERLHENPVVSRCVVTQLFRYALGRREQPADACVLQTLTERFSEDTHSLTEWLVAFVRSDAFRYRPIDQEVR